MRGSIELASAIVVAIVVATAVAIYLNTRNIPALPNRMNSTKATDQNLFHLSPIPTPDAEEKPLIAEHNGDLVCELDAHGVYRRGPKFSAMECGEYLRLASRVTLFCAAFDPCVKHEIPSNFSGAVLNPVIR